MGHRIKGCNPGKAKEKKKGKLRTLDEDDHNLRCCHRGKKKSSIKVHEVNEDCWSKDI